MLTSGLKYSVQNDGELIIRQAQYNDGGAYECVARTSRERVEAFTNLVVRGARRLQVVPYFGERQRHALDSKDTRCEGSTFESRVRGCILLSCLSLAEIRDYTGKH